MDMTAKLCLHTGAYHVTMEEVAQAETPARTATHVPIEHTRLLDLLFGALDSLGVRLNSQEHALANNGQRYFGLFGTDLMGVSGAGTVIGLRNSHDKSFPASLVLGTRVFVCDNLAFSGEVKLSRKHTSFIERDLPGVVMRGAERLIEFKSAMADRIGSYKALPLWERDADHMVCNLVRGRGLAPSQVGHVLAEFDKPSHPEHLSETGDRTVWTLYNAVTEAYKGSNLFTLPKRSEILHAVCDSAVLQLQ